MRTVELQLNNHASGNIPIQVETSEGVIEPRRGINQMAIMKNWNH